MPSLGTVSLLDYGAGNVRSLINAVEKLGWSVKKVESPDDILKAEKLLFPGVGAFGYGMQRLRSQGYDKALLEYIKSDRPFMGICVGMQCLFSDSEESPGVPGLAVIPASVRKFDSKTKSVPHMGWNAATSIQADPPEAAIATLNHDGPSTRYYFVHSYAVPYTKDLDDWVYSTTTYGNETFVSSVRRKNIFATQFHPEKSGYAGLKALLSFLTHDAVSHSQSIPAPPPTVGPFRDMLTRRVIACLDVRTNDEGDLVVTKGDQYDVRERSEDGSKVRNLGKPVELAKRYFEDGADEITFLNITSFRDAPLKDLPMLEVLKRTSETVFVPLTIGGGIRDLKEPDGTVVSALDVAGEYFRSGADKVSIGSDAVYAAEQYFASGKKLTGETAIEQIATVYGNQAVVISVDPRRVYVDSPESAPAHHVIPTAFPGPNGEKFCWYQCTVKGGREGRDFDVYQLVTACEALGAGEILLNCMDKDGTNSGYDLELVSDVRAAVRIPVIASSGAGKVEHFSTVFKETNVEAALAAGIFHRKEVPLQSVKDHLLKSGFEVRGVEQPL
ncbi:Histidine biosynthesis bifunctional protein hisB [Rhizophlyctis rosea]|uniref:Imidazole glycerol phosphate synthase hisHF n=1 Tax=Rhizophlyctis rosea TaxID=64517 RepID=A0AAD5X7E5_9FUNG|nr:Histidine biosynthesis bifunctional protein hisB [Rhizophlyctis rosea]